jgi:hypothetical protein
MIYTGIKKEAFGENTAQFQLYLPTIPLGAFYLFILHHEILELFAE